MKQNMGTADRTIRVIVALIAGLLIMTGTLSGIAAIVVGIFALVFIVTSSISFCPLYTVLKLSTKKETK